MQHLSKITWTSPKGLVAWCHSFCLFFIFYNIHTYIHTITFIQYIYPSPFAEASLHSFIACLLSGGTQLVARRLAVRQARVRFSARHHREVPQLELLQYVFTLTAQQMTIASCNTRHILIPKHKNWWGFLCRPRECVCMNFRQRISILSRDPVPLSKFTEIPSVAGGGRSN